MSVYGHAAHIYRDHGWPGVLPLPEASKYPPPDGYTGADGSDPDDDQIARWADLNPDGNICLRMPTGVIGVDVDAYGDKHGAQSLDDLARRLGPLTPTWRSSARDAPSGIYFYRVPPGRYQANPATNIEIIQRNHRYAVVGPSIHPQTGDPYRWYTPNGDAIRLPPFCKRDLTGLPRPYIDEWRIRETDNGDRMWTPKPHRLDDWTPAVTRAYAKALFAMPGGRHDACRDGALALVRLYSLEHPGAQEAVDDLGARFRQAISDRATPAQADKEWRDILQGAVGLVRATPSEAPKWEPHAGGRPDPNWAPWWPQDEPAGEPAAVTVRARAVPGGDFALDIPDVTPAIWGDGSEVLWAEGESMLLVGPPGVGKTTVTHQIVLARLGIGAAVLGWTVKPCNGRMLYLACDRPAQIARSLHRMVGEEHRDILNEKLTIWRGPPPADFAKDTELLTKMALEYGADTVFVDSLKDVAIGLVDDDVGAGYNRARQHALAEGIELGELHHQRKGQGGVKPKALEDVYGSIWLTAGAGSVVLLWGQGGDPLVELIHLKQPADQIHQPLTVNHDHDRGVSTLVGAVDIVTLIKNHPKGMTAPEVARVIYEKTPTHAEIEKTRRKLDSHVKAGHMTKTDSTYVRCEWP